MSENAIHLKVEIVKRQELFKRHFDLLVKEVLADEVDLNMLVKRVR